MKTREEIEGMYQQASAHEKEHSGYKNLVSEMMWTVAQAQVEAYKWVLDLPPYGTEELDD